MGWLTRYRDRRRTRALAEAESKIAATSQTWLSQPQYRKPAGAGAIDAKQLFATELPIYGVAPPELVSAINAALAGLEQGQFYAAAYLWDGMTRDDRLSATLNVRLSGLLGSRLDLLPADDTPEALAVKERFEKRLSKVLPAHQLAQLQRTGLGLSVAIGQVLSTRSSKGRDATLRVWNNRFLRYDWTLRSYMLVTENRGEIAIDPEDDEWVIYEPFGPMGWLHGALVRQLAMPWIIRQWTRRWWSRYQEVHGHPIRAGIVPAERSPADERRFLQQLTNLAHEAVVRLPQGDDGNKFDVKLIEAEAGGWQGFRALLQHCDDAFAVAVLGQRQSTDGQGGLGSQEKAGEPTILRILRGDAIVGDVLRDRVLMPLCRDNDGNPELAPYLKWDIEPPEDNEAHGRAFFAVAQGLTMLTQAPEYSRHIDSRALLEDHGLPLIPIEQLPPVVAGSSGGSLPETDPDDETDPVTAPATEDATK